MRATTLPGVQPSMPEFKARRVTEPRFSVSFAEQLGSRETAVASPASRPGWGAAPPKANKPGAVDTKTGRTFPAATAPDPREAQGTRGPERPVAPASDPDIAKLDPDRARILARAEALLDVPYVWGGNGVAGMDCSAYVSRAWGVGRHTTDSLSAVAEPIAKEELRAGDAMNLPTWKDSSGHGHVRLFDRWGDAAKTKVWVYEETAETGKSVHRLINYDPKYDPMRLKSLSA